MGGWWDEVGRFKADVMLTFDNATEFNGADKVGNTLRSSERSMRCGRGAR